MGKLGLLAAVLALVFAIIPVVQYKELSTPERMLSDLTDSARKLQRHVTEDSKFKFSLEGKDRWHSLAMICAVIAVVLGLVSLSSEWMTGGTAMVIGLIVGVWQYFGT